MQAGKAQTAARTWPFIRFIQVEGAQVLTLARFVYKRTKPNRLNAVTNSGKVDGSGVCNVENV